MKRVLHAIRHSLSIRLVLLFIITGMVIGSIEIFAVSRALHKGFETTLKPHLRQYVKYLLDDIGTPPNLERAKQLSQELPLPIQINGPDVNWTSRPAGLLSVGDVHLHEHGMINGSPVETGYYKDAQRIVLRARSGDYDFLFFLPAGPQSRQHKIEGSFFLAAILLVLYGAFRAIRWLFHPLDPIRAGVRRIGEGDLSHRINLRCKDELGDLGKSIDLMADDIEKMLEAKRQLLLAISHELRSPIARAKVSLELVEEDRVRGRLDADLQEMADLIDLLIEGERLKGRHSALQRRPTEVDLLTRDLIEARFSETPIEFSPTGQDAYLLVDPVRLQLLLKNLIENAVRFNRTERGPVEVDIKIENANLIIRVRDQGEGIAPEHLQQVTEPFYRVDESRQRKTGGFGLGLYLCRMIAEAHGGSLDIECDDQGTRIRVDLPIGAE